MPLELGIFTQYVRADSVEALADKIAAYGLKAAILDIHPGLDVNFDEPTTSQGNRIRRAFEQAGVSIVGLGGYQNLAHPDPSERLRIYNRLVGMIRLCETIGASMLCTETGSYNPNGYDWDPANVTDQALRRVADFLRPLLDEARARGVTIALEPYVMTVTGTTARLAQLIDLVGGDGLQVIFDPVGILSRATLDDQQQFLTESFRQVARHLGLVHVQDCTPAEDIKHHFNWQCAGTGLVNYPLFMDLLIDHGYDGPLILEFLEETQISHAVEFVASQWNQALARRG